MHPAAAAVEVVVVLVVEVVLMTIITYYYVIVSSSISDALFMPMLKRDVNKMNGLSPLENIEIENCSIDKQT